MKKIEKLFGDVNVLALQWALRCNEQLWNANAERTSASDSPHREVDDIWVRYMTPPFAEGPHESVWYPAAACLPVREVVFPLFASLRGERLGGVLITRIAPGKQVYSHIDEGWHARYYEKFAVQIQSAPGQLFQVEDEALEAKPGDVYRFDNSFEHWVINPTPYERITMICCIKTGGAVMNPTTSQTQTAAAAVTPAVVV
jgi:Aspartyl/Asparaginyl beta-hydroxylase